MLAELPRLPNFKIDRVGLAELDAARPIEMRDRLEDPLLDEVAGIFEAAIGASGVTADDTLASIGGDSLQAVIVAAELERRYAVAIPDHLIEGHPTIREIARWLRTGLSAAAQ
jgi:acyl carrier protein